MKSFIHELLHGAWAQKPIIALAFALLAPACAYLFSGVKATIFAAAAGLTILLWVGAFEVARHVRKSQRETPPIGTPGNVELPEAPSVQKPQFELPMGSLALQNFTADADRKVATGKTSMQMIIELRNANDFLIKFHAKMTSGQINGKELSVPNVEFDGYVYPKHSGYLKYGRIFDVPVSPTHDATVPAFRGSVNYDVRYWPAEVKDGLTRRTAKRVTFELWAIPGRSLGARR